jgi:AcrR family transcriptional regulator
VEAEAAQQAADDDDGTARPAGYRRSAGTTRGIARREDLLERVADDVGVHGLAGFSLRRAARAAGTTHKVLLYHFAGADELLVQVVTRLRERRIDRGLLAAAGPADRPLADRVRAIWPVLVGTESEVLDQAIGLALHDPARHAELGRQASRQYLPSLLSLCPADWSEQRKYEVAQMILATLRGFLIEARTSGDREGIGAGFDALVRALEREEAAGS